MDEVDLNGTEDYRRDRITGHASTPSDQAFSLVTLIQCFREAVTDRGNDVRMMPYLAAFKEIVKFLELLGTVFHFVISDVKSKIAILEGYAGSQSHSQHQQQAGDDAGPAAAAAAAAAHYSTVCGMVEHEVCTDAVASKQRPSGCRTLLRLHRALEYTLLFFRRLHDSDDSQRLSSLSSSVYGETLSKHHPWVIRKAVGVAMYAMPSRQALVQKLQASGDGHGDLKALLLEAADAGAPTYDSVQAAFAKHKLLELP